MKNCYMQKTKKLLIKKEKLKKGIISNLDLLMGSVVRAAEERFGLGSVFDSICKLQLLVQKAKTADAIVWCFQMIYDQFCNGQLKDASIRHLDGRLPGGSGKGLVEELLFKRSLGEVGKLPVAFVGFRSCS